MAMNKGPAGTRPGKQKGEQFSDPLSWSPEMKADQGPPKPSRADEDAARREKQIAAKIVAEYSKPWYEWLKPLIGLAILALLAYNQFAKIDRANAFIYTVMVLMAATSFYVVLAHDNLPPIINLAAKLIVLVCVAIGGIWFIANGSDLFSPKKEGGQEYKRVHDIDTKQ